jgi:hypothetical protein
MNYSNLNARYDTEDEDAVFRRIPWLSDAENRELSHYRK